MTDAAPLTARMEHLSTMVTNGCLGTCTKHPGRAT